MKHIFNKTFLYVNKLAIIEVESSEIDVNDFIYTMNMKKNLNEKRTLQKLKRDYKGKSIQKVGDCWIIG